MKISNEEIIKLLSKQGLRPTKIRQLLLEIIAQTPNHLSTESILSELKKYDLKFGVATVYQNLEKLVLEGVIARFTSQDGLSRFDFTTKPHHHLSCFNCGVIVDVELDENLLQKMTFQPCTDSNSWSFDQIQLEIKGQCPECA